MRSNVDRIDYVAVEGYGGIHPAWSTGHNCPPIAASETLLHGHRADSGEYLRYAGLVSCQPVHGKNPVFPDDVRRVALPVNAQQNRRRVVADGTHGRAGEPRKPK